MRQTRLRQARQRARRMVEHHDDLHLINWALPDMNERQHLATLP